MDIKNIAFDFAMNTQRIDCLKTLNLLFERNIEKFGYQHYVYSDLSVGTTISIPKRQTGKLCRQWQARYLKKEHYRHDLCVQLSQHTLKSFTWGEARVSRIFNDACPDSFNAGLKVINEASEYNLHSGINLPLKNWDGGVSVVSLMSSEKYLTHTETEKFALELIKTFYAGSKKRINNQNNIKEKKLLTVREREILSFISQGKQYNDISIIIGITPKTIRRHMENARNRMNVVTTHQLLAESIKRGEIFL